MYMKTILDILKIRCVEVDSFTYILKHTVDIYFLYDPNSLSVSTAMCTFTNVDMFEQFMDSIQCSESTFNKHYFVGQHIEISGLVRSKGDGKNIIINATGVIKEVRKIKGEICYAVKFNIELEHRSCYGSKWKTKTNSWNVFHNTDSKHIIKVF